MTALAPIQSTIRWDQLAARRFDLVVIGAGPAGVSAALAARASGLAVLLVDRASFPRNKVCGCCLNASGLATLDALDATHVLDAFKPHALHRMLLAAEGRVASIRLDAGIAISRSAMDGALIELAIERGVQFIARTSAEVRDSSCILRSLDESSDPIRLTPGLTIIAMGLSGRADDDELIIHRASRIGVGAVLEPDDRFDPGVIYMAAAEDGYVGIVVLEDGRLDVAGTFDPQALRRFEHVGLAVNHTLDRAGLPPLREAKSVRWRGTPGLSRRRNRVWRTGALFVGDAAGYVEPFTGEGMAWALGSGRVAGDLAGQAGGRWSVELGRQWQREYRQIRARQRTCRLLAFGVRSATIRRLGVKWLTMVPGLARPIVTELNRRLDWPGPPPRSFST